MKKTLKSRYQTVPPLEVGQLVEYKYPSPENQDLLGIVLRLREVESNVYERGFLEAEVHWNAVRWRGSSYGKMSRFETGEEVLLLKILS